MVSLILFYCSVYGSNVSIVMFDDEPYFPVIVVYVFELTGTFTVRELVTLSKQFKKLLTPDELICTTPVKLVQPLNVLDIFVTFDGMAGAVVKLVQL